MERKPVNKCKALIVEGHAMLREYLTSTLKQILGLSASGHAEDIHEAMRMVHETRPDIVIVGNSLRGPGSLNLVENIRAQELQTGILVLSTHDDDFYAERALQAGANGYLPKDATSAEVALAVSDVLHGRVHASQSIIDKLLARRVSKPGQPKREGMPSLATRELEVFRLLGCGRSTRDIARSLELRESTVQTYRARIKTKLRLRSTAELHIRAGHWVRDQAKLAASMAQAVAFQIPAGS